MCDYNNWADTGFSLLCIPQIVHIVYVIIVSNLNQYSCTIWNKTTTTTQNIMLQSESHAATDPMGMRYHHHYTQNIMLLSESHAATDPVGMRYHHHYIQNITLLSESSPHHFRLPTRQHNELYGSTTEIYMNVTGSTSAPSSLL